MNLRVSLYDTLVNNRLLVRVYDLDNEGRKGIVKIFVSDYQPPITVEIEHLSLSPIDIFIDGTPITGSIHEVTAKIFAGDDALLHDTDTRMIKMGRLNAS